MYDLNNSLTRATFNGTGAAITGSGNGTGLDITQAEGRIRIDVIHCGASGTNPTLALSIEESDTLGGDYTDISNDAVIEGVTTDDFTGLTGTAGVQFKILDTRQLKGFLRIVRTIGGTDTPTFYTSVRAEFVPKRV
jgi:hypothetical protein